MEYTKEYAQDSLFIPVLDGAPKMKEGEFKEALTRWCRKWVPERGLRIMYRWEELYENRAVHLFLRKWADAKGSHERAYEAMLESAAEGKPVDTDGFGYEIYSKQVARADEALTELLFAVNC